MKRGLHFLLAIGMASPAAGQSSPVGLKLLISTEQPSITFPFPARLTLQIHNAGQDTVWLYRRARNPESVPESLPVSDRQVAETTGGSTLKVNFQPLTPPTPQDVISASHGSVVESVGLFKPKLARLGAGEDYDEKATLALSPTILETQGQKKPLWGRYRLTVVYAAKYSNAVEIERNLGTTVWQGEVESNAVEIELLPPAQTQGSISGKVVSSDGQGIYRARVSLVDEQERVLTQAATDDAGRFSFEQLPAGYYFVVAARPDPREESAVFQHVVLSASEPTATVDFIIPSPEIYEAPKILHKPVLFCVTDAAGRSMKDVQLEITWSNGTVLDDVKAETGSNGLAAVELIPGRSFVTLRRRGCEKQDERADVAPGNGIDGFKMVYDCDRK